MRIFRITASRCAGVAAICATAAAASAQPVTYVGSLEAIDPVFHRLVPANARLEKLAEGFDWSEGPVWRKSGGYLLFSDVPKNTIYRWSQDAGLSVFLRPAGLSAGDPPGRELGSNGLVFDGADRLVLADHGNRQLARLDESNFTKHSVASRYDSRRFNSPNDVAVRSNGDLYFTDPPYGLDGLEESRLKELPHSGVYRVTPGGAVTLLSTELRFPNGLAFAPDERTLYVASSDGGRPELLAYDVNDDGTLGAWRVFFDAAPLLRAGRRGALDGLKVDRAGNLFATGPGGVLVITPAGRHVGTILTGVPTANCAFGDDGSSLYITADSMLLRIRLDTRGMGF